MLGVDNAGKSTLLYSLRKDIREYLTATVGFSSEVVTEGRYTAKVFDLGGCANFRGIWQRYFAEVHGVIFVVDGSSQQEVDRAKPVLLEAASDPRLRGKPAVLFVNKQDVPNSLTPEEVDRQLSLSSATSSTTSTTTSTTSNRGGMKMCGSLGCVAKASDVEHIDERLTRGFKWLLDGIEENWKGITEQMKVQVAEQQKADDLEREERRLLREKLRKERLEKEAEDEAKQKENEEKEKQSLREQANQIIGASGEGQSPLHHQEKEKEEGVMESKSGEEISAVSVCHTPNEQQGEEEEEEVMIKRPGTPERWKAQEPIIVSKTGDNDSMTSSSPSMTPKRRQSISGITPVEREIVEAGIQQQTNSDESSSSSPPQPSTTQSPTAATATTAGPTKHEEKKHEPQQQKEEQEQQEQEEGDLLMPRMSEISKNAMKRTGTGMALSRRLAPLNASQLPPLKLPTRQPPKQQQLKSNTTTQQTN